MLPLSPAQIRIGCEGARVCVIIAFDLNIHIFYLQNNKIEQSWARIEYSTFLYYCFASEEDTLAAYGSRNGLPLFARMCTSYLLLRVGSHSQINHTTAKALFLPFARERATFHCHECASIYEFRIFISNAYVCTKGKGCGFPWNLRTYVLSRLVWQLECLVIVAGTNNKFNKFMNLFSVCIRKLCVAHNERR